MSTVTGWVLTLIMMTQPHVYIVYTEFSYDTVEQCVEARDTYRAQFEDDDPATHLVIGCEPRYD